MFSRTEFFVSFLHIWQVVVFALVIAFIFLVINSNWKETALTGLDQLMAYFEPILGKSTVSANDDNNLVDTTTNNPVKTEEQKRNSTWFLIIVALIACWSSYWFIKASNKK